MYAIVDIETTGGYAANNAITEVAIVLHDGKRECKRYETLINPGMAIPTYVQSLTGITDGMVSDAPFFAEIAPFYTNASGGPSLSPTMSILTIPF